MCHLPLAAGPASWRDTGGASLSGCLVPLALPDLGTAGYKAAPTGSGMEGWPPGSVPAIRKPGAVLGLKLSWFGWWVVGIGSAVLIRHPEISSMEKRRHSLV